MELPGGAALPDTDDSCYKETSLRGDVHLLEQIEALEAVENRVASASMQMKDWKLPLKDGKCRHRLTSVHPCVVQTFVEHRFGILHSHCVIFYFSLTFVFMFR